ncbi:MAG: hypothetical protein ABEJ92_06935 [Halobacteriales archaeon]
MGLWLDITRIAAGFNVVLLAALVVVWGRNYRRFRSKHTLGLLVFGTLMLAENGLALYFFTVDPYLAPWFNTAMPEPPQLAMMALRLVTSGALLFLAWVTWD